MKISLLSMIIILLITYKINAQDYYEEENEDESCGGSCLMQIISGGIGGGYEYQSYSAEGLNNFLNVYNNKRSYLDSKFGKFGMAKGFFVNVTLWQMEEDGIIFGIKLNYHWLKEKQSASGIYNSKRFDYTWDLSFYQFDAGIYTKLRLSRRLLFKLLELDYTPINLILKQQYSDEQTLSEKTLRSDAAKGWKVSTGLQYFIIPKYLSLEGTLGYSLLPVDGVRYDNAGMLTVDETSTRPMNNFIKSGGFFASMQMNFAIPF